MMSPSLSPSITSLSSTICVCGYVGILLAHRDVSFLAQCYGLNTILMVGYLWLGQAANLGIRGVWFGLLAFQVVRFLQFLSRVVVTHGWQFDYTHFSFLSGRTASGQVA